MVALAIARGGAELFASKASASSGGSGQLLDIGRVRMRLEGLQLYATICALLTNGCLRLYSSVPPKHVDASSTQSSLANSDDDDDKSGKRIGLDLFLVCVIVSVLFGSYTTIVFGLLSLYSKTALGRGYDSQFLEFWAATAGIRESGFEAFMYSLVSFELAFILSLFLRFRGRRRNTLVILAVLISILNFRRYATIMQLAVQYLFPLRAEVQY